METLSSSGFVSSIASIPTDDNVDLFSVRIDGMLYVSDLITFV